MLCYVDHHDEAYRWAERRKLETHPKTGAAQLVEIRETVEEIAVPVYVPVEQEARSKLLPFSSLPDDEILNYGIPIDWLPNIRAADEDTILDLASHLPSEAAEALLELATGGTPRFPRPAVSGIDPFDHPDAQRRFRVMRDWEELERALNYPWEKWAVFLHPAQRAIVGRDFSGPARVSLTESQYLDSRASCIKGPSNYTKSRILSTTSSSKRRALSLGVSQASLPRFIIDWQT